MISSLLGVAFLAAAATCWYAGQRRALPPFHILFPVAKVATATVLILWAITLGATDTGTGWAVLVALAFGLVGDVALLRGQGWAFWVGVAAFLAGHAAYLVAFAAITGANGLHPVTGLIGAILVAPFAVRSLPRVRGAVLADGDTLLAKTVLAYGVALLALAVLTGLSGRVVAVAGAVLFTVSYTVLGLDRFVGPRARAGLVVLTTYHLAQAGLMLGALAA
ncbi:MAG: lysoplasmalogenase family protein [Dermatophilaceae bacterium]